MSATPRLHRCQAMRAPFTLRLLGLDADLAASAHLACDRVLQRLDGLFSRYRPDSDICRIANAAPGTRVPVAWETLEVLRRAAAMHAASRGAFDPSVGAWVDAWRAAGRSWSDLDADTRAACAARQGLDRLDLTGIGCVSVRDDAPTAPALDLGAIGKGYALDRMAELLREDWDCPAFLLDAGGSTVLARGDTAWRIGVGGPWGAAQGLDAIALRDGALSASSGEVQGLHILDPRRGPGPTVQLAAWALADDACTADAASTALLVLDDEAGDACCAAVAGLHAYTVGQDGRVCAAAAFHARALVPELLP